MSGSLIHIESPEDAVEAAMEGGKYGPIDGSGRPEVEYETVW